MSAELQISFDETANYSKENWASLIAACEEAQRLEPDYGCEKFSEAETRLFELIEFYRIWNPKVGAMLSKAYLTLKNWE